MQVPFAFSRKSLLSVFASAFLIFGSTLSHAQDDPPPQAGRLSFLSGAVSLQAAGTDDWGQAFPNYPIGPGDRIFTDSDGRAEIQIGQNYVRIGPDSDVTFVQFDSQNVTFGVAQGAVHVRTRGLWDGQSLYVQTPSGSTTVGGPADFRVDVMPAEPAAIFTTYSGDVYISAAGGFGLDSTGGQSLELVGSNPVYPQWLQPAGQDDLDRWSESRDEQIERAASFRYVSPQIPGVDDLDANGQWVPGTDYGNVWVPNVPVGWAPYRNGHWVSHEPWGWVWVEDEPWGYAPFHFGRWVVYQGRWGWVPGPPAARPVWSPALVVFAGGMQAGGGGVSAWFPLGPGEAYRPWYPCSPQYVDQVNISNITPTRVVHVQNTYVNIVNVTNVTNITYVNRTVGVTAVRQQDFAAGRPVAQAAVHVDPQQVSRMQILAKPTVAAPPRAVIAHPPVRPVPVQAARPVLINAKGLAVAATPNARPVPPQVKAAVSPRPVPGRTVIAPPPNVKMTPAARQAIQAHPAAPAATPARPVATTPAPSQRPAPVPQNQQNQAHPAAQPVERPAPASPTRPATVPEDRPMNKPPQQPEARPNSPNQQPEAHPEQVPPAARPAPPQQPKPTAPPEQKAAPRPMPPQQPKPNPQAEPKTEPHAIPPQQQARPNAPTEPKANPKQAPPEKDKKPEDKKPEKDKDENRPER
jgi:hypothetical protein